jgi:hypothetical protein
MLKVIEGNVHPSQTKYAIRVTHENDGTWDVDVYEDDDRDSDLSVTYIASELEATGYAKGVAAVLRLSGTVALDVPGDDTYPVRNPPQD